MNSQDAKGTTASAASPIDVSASQLELIRRGMMEVASEDLRHAADHLDELRMYSPWPVGVKSSDTQNSVNLARETLTLLDRLGWPDDVGETSGEDDCDWCRLPIRAGQRSVVLEGRGPGAGGYQKTYHASVDRDCFAEVQEAVELAQQLDRRAS